MIINSLFKILPLQLSHEKEYLRHLSMSVVVEKNYQFQMSTSITKHLLFLKSFYCLKSFGLDKTEQSPLSFAHLYNNCLKQYWKQNGLKYFLYLRHNTSKQIQSLKLCYKITGTLPLDSKLQLHKRL